MKLKKFLKRIAVKIFPTYRKLCAIQKTLDGRINYLTDETARALDASTNQCWSIRHQMLHVSQQLDASNQLSTQIDSMNRRTQQIQNLLWFAIDKTGVDMKSLM